MKSKKSQNRKKVLSLLTALAIALSTLLQGVTGNEPDNEPPEELPVAEEHSVQLMARDNVIWNNHNPWTSEPLTITSDGTLHTLKIEDFESLQIVSLSLMSEGANFCTGLPWCSRNDCGFFDSVRLPGSLYNTVVTFESVIANGNIPLIDEPVFAGLADEDYPFYTGVYANSELWNGWYEGHQRLTNVTVNPSVNDSGDSFSLVTGAWIQSIEVTFSVSVTTFCYDCGWWSFMCVCCDCEECERCLFVGCCTRCCIGFDWCDGDCAKWWGRECCDICSPCGECCECIECAGCAKCFRRCCSYCCKGFEDCGTPCDDCCLCFFPDCLPCCRCIEDCDGCCYCDGKECEGCWSCDRRGLCGVCNYCIFCNDCYRIPCVCIPCEDCDEFPCECEATFTINITGEDIFSNRVYTVAGEYVRPPEKAINPELIKGVRFTFDVPDFNCDGKHLLWGVHEIGGCVVTLVEINFSGVDDVFCYSDKQSITYMFEEEIERLSVGAYSVFPGNDGRVLVEVLGENDVVLKRGQQELSICDGCKKIESDCDCIELPADPCKICLLCTNPPQNRKGRILGTSPDPTIFDALQIVMYIVGMENNIDNCGNALYAALIVTDRTPETENTPTIFDALQIVLYVIGKENDIPINEKMP
jgi:hypothetical protein